MLTSPLYFSMYCTIVFSQPIKVTYNLICLSSLFLMLTCGGKIGKSLLSNHFHEHHHRIIHHNKHHSIQYRYNSSDKHHSSLNHLIYNRPDTTLNHHKHHIFQISIHNQYNDESTINTIPRSICTCTKHTNG